MTTRWIAVTMLLAFAASGCSISASSVSSSESSESSSNSSKSSSGSSGPGDEVDPDTAYRDDVRDETVLYATSTDDLEDFQAALSDVARRHGIVDWEASRATYVGIGQGLAHANVRGNDLDRIERRLAGDDASRREALRAGYAAETH
jgi:hypothetical protein